MTSIISNKNVIRPLVGVKKANLINYAVLYGVNWREDYTNSEINYTRNYLRRRIDASKNKRESHKLAKNIESIAKINLELDAKIATLSQKIMQDSQIDRSLFTLLPPIIAKELLVYWLRDLDQSTLDKRTVERLYIKLKTAPHNSKHDVNNRWRLVTERDKAFFSNNRVGSLI